MKVSMNKILYTLFVLTLKILTTNSVAVVSIDFGCEYVKMAIVMPGMPMETILTPESSRKFINVVGIKNEEIIVGEAALTFCVKKPKDVYFYLNELLGKNIYNLEIERYRSFFPHYELTNVRDEKAFAFIHKNETYLPEELIAMVLIYCKEVAQKFAEDHAIVGYIITVPPYYNQAERQALIKAAEIADIKLIQTLNDNAAVALNYGLFRQKSFNSTVQNYIFYDMGACGTHASVVGYQMVQTNPNDTSTIYPQLTIKGFGFDRELGGRTFQIRLRDYLATSFNQIKHPGHPNLDVTSDARAMNVLYVEAGRAIKVLSANAEMTINIHNLIKEINFKLKLERTKFEELCQDIFEKATKPIEDAIKASGLQYGDIQQIILFGASTRIPKIQSNLTNFAEYHNLEIGKSLNTDEASALGAVYQAAYLSPGFRAKRFIIKESIPHSIKIEFEKDLEEPETLQSVNKLVSETSKKSTGKKIISKVLMPSGNICPQKKVITFNKYYDDFTFNVSYGDLISLPQNQIRNFASLNLSQITVKGVRKMLLKHLKNDNATTENVIEFKGIKAHFALDDNCLVSLQKVDIHFEKIGPRLEEEESTFSKLGSKIKNFFAGMKGESPNLSLEDNEDTEKKFFDDNTVVDKKGQPNHEEGADNSKLDKLGDDTKNETNTIKNSTLLKHGNVTHSHPIVETLKFEVVNLDFPQITKQEFHDCRKRIRKLKENEFSRKELAEIRNNLESTMYDTKEKFEYDEILRNFSSTQEREDILKKISTVQAWYEDDGSVADKNELKNKLDDIKQLLKPIDNRIVEYDKIFKGLDRLYRTLNDSSSFLEVARNLSTSSSALPIFEPVQIDKFESLLLSTSKWFNDTVEYLNSAELSVDPKLHSKDVKEKSRELDKELTILRNKGREAALNQAKKLSENLNFQNLKDKIDKETATKTTEGTGTDTSPSPETPTTAGTSKTTASQPEYADETPTPTDSFTESSTTKSSSQEPVKEGHTAEKHPPDEL